ncbi:VanZ family protein [Streptomyces sp. RKAG337]|uniref:VanZ family protein n=1 Tax=Streptomyces sp. RKAG337 TaxID=2893404 RepID=UPI002033D394|nr:VanZ family protein [Streptomyces sp. RKAG337]MCM2427795.1 VanZ family protein [Streptomyces sp. RKAG337]
MTRTDLFQPARDRLKAKRTPKPRSKAAGARWKPTSWKPVGKSTRKPAAKRVPKPRTKPVSRPARDPRDEPREPRSFAAGLTRALVMVLAFVFMVGFAVVLAKLTLQPSPASVKLIHTNLRPGDSIRQYIDQPAFRDTVKQIGGNLVLGVPFGILLPVLFPKTRGLLRVVLVTAVVMVLVEAAQGAIVEGRAFDIDDVILNTTGALIGYLLLGRRLGRALHPRRHHWWQRRQPSDGEGSGRRLSRRETT